MSAAIPIIEIADLKPCPPRPGAWPERVVVDGREVFIERRPIAIAGQSFGIDGQILGEVYAWLRGRLVTVLEVTR
jgi:hypothetical protein